MPATPPTIAVSSNTKAASHGPVDRLVRTAGSVID
jgi:hypothetical protein